MTDYLCIDARQMQAVLQDSRARVLDIRSPAAFAAGHVPDALPFNDALLASMRREWPADIPIVVVCEHGHSSRDLAQLLSHLGFTQVHSLDGGYVGWRAAQRTATPAVDGAMTDLDAWLLAQGFDPTDLEWPAAHAMTALLHAARLGDAGIVRALLAAGASVAAVNADGNNALWLACYADSPACAELLIRAGTAIDQTNLTGATALMYAASAGRDRMVGLLLQAGADPGRRNQDDFTAFDMAATETAYFLLRPRRSQTA
jgi:thiosulfate/3-mercaptopyruvate sulfurtransferase